MVRCVSFRVERIDDLSTNGKSMVTLNRSLGLTQLVFYGVGSIVGAGIYAIIGTAAGEAGRHLWISFLGAGVAGFLTVLSYSELSSTLTKAGAEYQYIKAAFPRWRVLAFMAGFLIALNASATAATVSIAFAGYVNVFITTPIFLTAFGLLLVCTIINIAGIREATWVSIGLTCVEVAGLLLIIVGGFIKGDPSKSFESVPTMKNILGVLEGSALIFFVYIGFEDVVNLSEETHQPKKNIPKALLLSAGITTVIYILVAFAVIGITSPQVLATSKYPLTTAASVLSPWLGKAIGIAALFATASTAMIALVSISRMLYGMARDGYMPKLLTKVLPRRRTPWMAAITLFIAASLFLIVGKIKIIASVSSFGVLIVFIGIHVAVIVLRYTRPRAKRHFLVPLSIGKFPLLPLVGIVLMLGLLTQFELAVYLIGLGAMLGGLLLYMLLRPKDGGR